MTRLDWGSVKQRFYETGIDRGVFYISGEAGIPWTGLLSVEEKPQDSETKTVWADGLKIQSRQKRGSFAATLEALSYPDGFRPGREFNLSYRTQINGPIGDGFFIHLVYRALAAPSAVKYETVNDSTNPSSLSWDLTTSPVSVSGAETCSHLVIDTRVAYSWAVDALEAIIYGSDTTSASFPEPQVVLDLFENASILKITDLGDGTFEAEGPDSIIRAIAADMYEIEWPSVVYIDPDTASIHSL